MTDESGGKLIILIIVVVLFIFYFLPSIFAFNRAHPNRWVILIINTFFGTTILAWIACLIWSLNAVHRSKNGLHGGESGLNLAINDVKRIAPVYDNEQRSQLCVKDAVQKIERLGILLSNKNINQEEYDLLKKSVLSKI